MPPRGPLTVLKPTKWLLYERDGGICWLCGGHVPHPSQIQALHPSAPSVDHIVPRSRKGANITSLTKLAHRSCNSKRGNPMPSVWDIDWQSIPKNEYQLAYDCLKRFRSWWESTETMPDEAVAFFSKRL